LLGADLGKYGASPSPGQSRYLALFVKGQKIAFALDREGEFKGSAKDFESLFKG
jgi:hypothetical protein